MEYLKASKSTAISTDISREGLKLSKIAQLWRLFAPRNNHAIVKVSEFRRINIQRINELIGSNFKAVILDIDECVAPHHGEILPENIDHIAAMVGEGTKLVIYSNMKASDRYEPVVTRVKSNHDYDIKIIMSPYAKPDIRGFAHCIDELNLEPDEDVLMIGDNFLTDGGSLQAGIAFAQVKPIRSIGESIAKRLKRIFQTSTRSFYSGVSGAYDRLGRRHVLRDSDFE